MFVIKDELEHFEKFTTMLQIFLSKRSDPDPVQFLCTGASLYAPYSLLLISNKFWMGRGGRWGVGGGEATRPSLRWRIKGVEGWKGEGVEGLLYRIGGVGGAVW
jgi:hypothetical protein